MANCPSLRVLEIAAVFSGNHNDPESWRDWADKGQQEQRIRRFKRQFAPEKTNRTDPLAILVVNNMLLTGFDAPVEQALYLDRKMVAHELLQAIARVNRTCGRKKCGYVVDYLASPANHRPAAGFGFPLGFLRSSRHPVLQLEAAAVAPTAD